MSIKHAIPLRQAIEMTKKFREQKELILAPEHHGKNLLGISETFDRAAFDQLLGQSQCTQVRIYYGMDANLQVHAIVVGVDGSGNDLLPDATSTDTPPTGPIVVEDATFCPPLCGKNSPLNP